MTAATLRARFAVMARRFPPAFVAQRVLPWTTLTAVIVGGAIALMQYSNDLGIARSAAALEMHKQFRDDAGDWSSTLLRNADGDAVSIEQFALEILKIRCLAYAEAVETGTVDPKDTTLPDCVDLRLWDQETLDKAPYSGDADLRITIAQRVRAFMVDDTKVDRGQFFRVSRYLRAVAVCVDRRTCDQQTAIALFAHEMTGFVNAACPHAQSLGSEGQYELRFLAGFLGSANVRDDMYWSDDKNRKKLFLCPSLNDPQG